MDMDGLNWRDFEPWILRLLAVLTSVLPSGGRHVYTFTLRIVHICLVYHMRGMEGGGGGQGELGFLH